MKYQARDGLQRLYTWVKEENCPNFFIPENNMFENRIYGENKQTLQNVYTGKHKSEC
jgi:hypothetical protein